jgi:hypothetical protein
MLTLKAQLRAGRDANVAKMELFEDGSLKYAEFFPVGTPAELEPKPDPAQPPRIAAPMDLLTEVVMAEGNPVILDADDFPDSDVDSSDASAE